MQNSAQYWGNIRIEFGDENFASITNGSHTILEGYIKHDMDSFKAELAELFGSNNPKTDEKKVYDVLINMGFRYLF